LTSLSDHESNVVQGRDRPHVFRLLIYARPYLALIALTLLLSLVYSGGQYARAYLIKPAIDDIALPSASLKGNAWSQSVLGVLDLGGSSESPPEAEATAEEPAADDRARVEALTASISHSILMVTLVAIAIVITMPLVMFAREYLVAYVLGRIDLDMKVDICRKLLALPLGFHQDRKRGDVLTRVMADVGGAHAALSLLFGDFVEAALMIAVGVGALFLVSWELALMVLGFGPLIFGVISLFGQRIRTSAKRRQEQLADVNQRLLEILSGIKLVKAFRAERLESEAFGRSSHRLFRRAMKVVKNRLLARSLVELLNHAAAVAVLLIGIAMVIWGWITLGELSAFVLIMVTVYKPVRAAAKGWVRLLDALPSAERFFEILDNPVDIRDAPDAVPLDGVREGIRLRDVSFSYGREAVLRGVSFEAAAGTVVAIVGRTGVGKTTLVDLLLRLHDPTSGAVEIDGVDIRRIRRDSLLDHMAVVTQESFLFDGSIADNIRYGRPEAAEEEVLIAARTAHVDEFAERLPDGYATEVGAAGTRLSGGQRQRIAIARAILRDPDILIFDEATSSLDSKSERYVQQAIERLLEGRTVFVIAHRLATVRRADVIIVLEDGAISQAGNHEELVRAGGLYRELVELQTPAGQPGLT
jgi:subfamily B ATP-binding cassette protein MsbA